MKKIFIVFSLILIGLIGCKKDENPVSPSPGGQNTNPTGQPIPTFSEANNGVLASIKYKQNVMGFPIEMKMAFANLGEGGKDAGNVYVNTTQLSKVTMANTTYYMAPYQNSPEPNIDFNGQTHRWEVGGNSASGIPSFFVDVVSPTNFQIIEPAANANVSKSSGFTIRWGTATNTKIMINLTSTVGNAVFTKVDLPDNGSYSITAQDLSRFPAGKALLQVVKYRYSIKSVDGKNYIAVSEIIESIDVNIN
ncbi:MAG: hypothetical protein N2043_07220 [Ignavibacterium sp.]|nr:hypothetical protein [Ignavibacterium sp.]